MISASSIIRQLNAVTISMKLRDNMLYETASPTLLNLYDNFSAVAFLANSTPPNLSDNVPIFKHVNDFINNMRPAQRSSSTTAATEWFICLTDEEHQHHQRHPHLQTRPFNHHQQQRPRLQTQDLSDQLLGIRGQHSISIRNNPSQRGRRCNIVPLLLRSHRNIKFNVGEAQQEVRLHRIGANNWRNGSPHF